MAEMTSRREFMAMMAAGAVMTAEGLWMPGQKLISIPHSSTVTLSGFHDFAVGDVIRFSGHMTASEVRFRQHEYNKKFPELLKAVRENYIDGLYRVLSVDSQTTDGR
jgi:hypothetical protein